MKAAATFTILAAAVLLSACAEKPQTAGTKKFDAKPWEGAPGSAYVAAGWKAGDQAAWEAHMKTRSQGQDEYSRAPAKP